MRSKEISRTIMNTVLPAVKNALNVFSITEAAWLGAMDILTIILRSKDPMINVFKEEGASQVPSFITLLKPAMYGARVGVSKTIGECLALLVDVAPTGTYGMLYVMTTDVATATIHELLKDLSACRETTKSRQIMKLLSLVAYVLIHRHVIVRLYAHSKMVQVTHVVIEHVINRSHYLTGDSSDKSSEIDDEIEACCQLLDSVISNVDDVAVADVMVSCGTYRAFVEVMF